MLTIKSNFINFKDRQGESYTIDDLTLLTKALIKEDITNFKLKYVGGGFTAAIATKIYSKLTISNNGIVVIINDLSLHMVNKLLAEGYKKENIYLAYGKWNSDNSISDDSTVYNTMKTFIKANIKERLNVITLKELFDMNDIKIDGIIANPPYGKTGANIAKTIIDKVDYVEFVNLLPANDYKRNTTKDLFNYQSDMEAIHGFDGTTAIITTCSLIHKNKINNMSLEEFEINSFTRTILDKYFKINLGRTTYQTKCNIKNGPINYNILIPTRTSSGDHSGEHHLAYSKKAISYQINSGNIKTYEEAARDSKYLGGCSIIIPTQLEHDNIFNFIYSKNGFRFISFLFTTMHKDTLTEITYWFPKVDWTRSWTVEEILAEYGYTEKEITEVINDLDNFKGMND